MAGIKNYTINFGYDRPAGLTCLRKLVSAETDGESLVEPALG